MATTPEIDLPSGIATATDGAHRRIAIAHAPARPLRDVVNYELLLDCVHCGLCLEACPTYVLTRAEMDSPRGRIYLMKALAEGTLELDADAVRHLDLCLECRGCETACPSGVHYGKLIEQARVYVERNYRRELRSSGCAIGRSARSFPIRRVCGLLLAPLRMADRLGLRPLLRQARAGSAARLARPAAAARADTPRSRVAPWPRSTGSADTTRRRPDRGGASWMRRAGAHRLGELEQRARA